MLCYSNRWLLTVHSCFQPASLTPHPAPLQSLAAASRIGSRRVTHRPLEELIADLQLQQQDPVLGPALALTARSAPKPSNTKERSTRALVPQYPRRFLLKNGILRRGQADQRRGALEQLILPSSLGPDVPREVRDNISRCQRCTAVPCFRKKERDMMLGMVVR